MTTLERTAQDEQVAHFAAWLPDEFELRVAVKREHDQWFALQMEFDITGCGPTRADAVRQSFELLIAYLHAHFEEGDAFADAVRPIPRGLRARIILESTIARTLRRTMLRLPLMDESTYSLPPGLLPRFAS
jgi:hypothetical protein